MQTKPTITFSFVVFRLADDDEMAAAVGVTETTKEPKAYDHPTNPKIKFWDLPGIGTPNYPDLETYCKEVELEKYHAFLIFTASRFTENDLNLAKKIRSIEKKFFLIRTKIDNDARSEMRKRSFNERAMLEKIRRDCAENLSDLVSNEQDIFLITNHDPSKWDFNRLTQAILCVLQTLQRESLTLSLGVFRSLSTEMLKKKVEVLKGRMWMVAAASVVFPGLHPGLSASLAPSLFSLGFNLERILNEVDFYRSQLGIPEKESAEFRNLQAGSKDKVLKTYQTLQTYQTLISNFKDRSISELILRLIPIIGDIKLFHDAFHALEHSLELVEDAAFSILEEAAEIPSSGFDIA